jgi:hypothetical protein
MPMMIYFSSPKSSYDEFTINEGTVVVNEELRGDVDLVVESSRCSLDMKLCKKFSTIKVKKCAKLSVTKMRFIQARWSILHLD